MGLKDILANPGNPFQSSFLRAEQGRRQQEAFGLQQQLRRQSIQQNDMRLQQQQQQAAMQQQRVDTIRGYQGDKRGLVDVLYRDGDLEGAANLVEFQKRLDSLNSVDREAAKDRMKIIQNDTLDTSGSVLEAFKRDDGGRSGMGLAIQEGERFRQQYGMGDQVPDFRGMHPEEVKQWWENKYNRSYKNRKFEQDATTGGGTQLERLIAKEVAGNINPREVKALDIATGDRGKAPVQGTVTRHNENLAMKKDKFGFQITKHKAARTSSLRAEANKDLKVLKFMNSEIERIKALIRSGGPIDTKQVRAGLANLSGARVRALADLKQYGTFGTLPERIGNGASLFLSGEFSDRAFKQAYEFVTSLQDTYVTPGMDDIKNYWRGQGKGESLNPHSIARYDNPADLRRDMKAGLLTQKQAKAIANDNKQWRLKKP